mgnify:CR=1 FL=1
MIIYPNNQSKIIEFEEMALNAWPALYENLHNGCIIRYSNGYTKRANSVNALYFNENYPELIDYSEKFYKQYSLPTTFKIIKHKRYEHLDAFLDELKYRIIDNTNVKLIDLRTNSFINNRIVKLEKDFSDSWINEFVALHRLEAQLATISNMLKKITVPKIVASITIDSKIIGFGYGVIENNIIGIFDIYVNEKYRNKGYARKIMNKLLYWAKSKGIIYSYLQVMENNIVANKLYQSIGYKQYYKYWYRVK